MASFSSAIAVADITALKAVVASDGLIRKVTTLDATYDYPSSFYVFELGATYTERLPGIVQDTAATGYWVMYPSPLVLAAGNPSGSADFPGILWVNTSTNDRYISNPDLSWSAIAGGTSNGTTTTTTGFTQPSVLGNVTVDVVDSSGFSVGAYVYVEDGGTYEIISIPGVTQLELQNTGITGNAVPSTAIAIGRLVSPTGQPGQDAGTLYSSADQTLSATLVLTATDETIQYVEGDVTDRDVTLPAASSAQNKVFTIRNIGATYNITVGDGVLSVVVAPENAITVHSNGTVWREIY